jgi:hypothetical protein
MYTYTPRDSEGQFESWGDRVEESGSYGNKDIVYAALLIAAGAVIWKCGEWVWHKFK